MTAPAIRLVTGARVGSRTRLAIGHLQCVSRDARPARLIAAQSEAAGPEVEDAPPREVAARFANGLALRPQVDGDLLPADPGAAIRGGAGDEIPVMAGAAQDEFKFLIKGADGAQAAWSLPRLLGDAARAEKFRRGHAVASPDALIGQAITDFTFRAPALLLAEWRADAAAPTYLYAFAWGPREGLDGARHCLGIPFAFDCLAAERVAGVAGAQPPRALADSIHAAWVAFITSGDAGWPAYHRPERRAMIDDAASRVEHDAMRLQREIWLA